MHVNRIRAWLSSLDAALPYNTQRQQFGQAIGNFQVGRCR
jgi:hypothetical protein